MSYRRLAFIINPKSGTRAKAELLHYLELRTASAGFRYTVMHSRADGQYDDLRQQILAGEITDVIICGGDGTVSAIGASLLGVEVNIGIIPIGSGNGLARAASIPMKPGRALRTIFEGHTQWIDGFYINGKFSCMLSGIGFDAAVAHRFAVQKTRGLNTYAREAVKHYFESKPYHFTLQLNGETIDADSYFISIANSNQFGNNFTIAPKASLSDGLLDIVVVQKMSKVLIPFALVRQLQGRNDVQRLVTTIRKREILYFQTQKITIGNPEMAPLHIDGDPAETYPMFEIEIVPKAMRLLMPA